MTALTPASVIDTVFACINARVADEMKLFDNPDMCDDAFVRAVVLADLKEEIARKLNALILGSDSE